MSIAMNTRFAGSVLALQALVATAWTADLPGTAACANPVYLTVDPATMDFAPRVAEVLRRQQVKATFWVSNMPTRNGEGSFGNQWASWWPVIAGQGHEFASQTFDRVVWRSDLPGYQTAFRMKPMAGAYAGREFTFDPPKYCEQIAHAARRVEDFTGKKSLPLFHAPAGLTSSKLLAVVSACGYAHVGLARGGMLAGARPLNAVLADIRTGDVLMADLSTPTGSEPWALANLEPLIVALKQRGLCFETLRQHPAYKDWIASHGG
jgi:peptidoglycan/xylan/chitin deacetylase (PgdA/CDA1 family)